MPIIEDLQEQDARTAEALRRVRMIFGSSSPAPSSAKILAVDEAIRTIATEASLLQMATQQLTALRNSPEVLKVEFVEPRVAPGVPLAGAPGVAYGGRGRRQVSVCPSCFAQFKATGREPGGVCRECVHRKATWAAPRGQRYEGSPFYPGSNEY